MQRDRRSVACSELHPRAGGVYIDNGLNLLAVGRSTRVNIEQTTETLNLGFQDFLYIARVERSLVLKSPTRASACIQWLEQVHDTPN